MESRNLKIKIGLLITLLLMLSAYFFYQNVNDDPLVLRELPENSTVSSADVPIDRSLADLELGGPETTVILPDKKVVAAPFKKKLSVESSVFNTDDIGGYYDEHALAPEDEIAQVLESGPIGKEVVYTKEFGDEIMSTEEHLSMQAEPVEVYVEP